MARMQEDELKAIVQAEIKNAVGVLDTELSQDRIDGWDAYLKQPYGNEVDGRSSVVSSDVQDTVEWIMPSLMRIFTAGDAAVEFAPTGPEDEEAAKQATDYCNYIWDRDNPGFLNFHTWFKDALITKLGTVKVYWESREDWKKERYQGLDENSYALVVGSPDVEIVEHTENQSIGPDGMPVSAHDVVVRYKKESGKICVDPVPGDEVLFSRDAKDVQNCRFFAHKTKRTISDLNEEFPDKRDEIDGLSSDEPGTMNNESVSRSTVREDDITGLTATINRAMREVWITEAYVRVDYDGDGIAEMRQVTVAGTGNVVLKNEEWEGPRPFACVCPILMPHRLVGLSIPDLIKDIQLIKTAILRQFLDALYIANNPRYEVDVDRVEDPSEVLTSKPGGVVRKHGDAPVMTPVMTAPVADQALLGLNYVDQLRENRTGVSARTQGLGADTLHDTKGGQDLMFDAARMRIELIARIFAETGVKDAFKLILWNAHKYQDEARTVRLRNQWVPMDPREWSDEYDMTANVGLGHNDNEKQKMALGLIGALQEKIILLQGGPDGPMVNWSNLHNLAEKAEKAAGFKGGLFFSDPDDPNTPKPQPKPNPEMMKMQAEMQMKQQAAQMDGQMKQQEMQMNAQQSERDAQLTAQLKQQELEGKMAIERMQAEADIATKQADLVMRREEHAMKMQLEMTKAQAAERDANINSRMAVHSHRMKMRESRSKYSKPPK
jgi:hypothetical protein